MEDKSKQDELIKFFEENNYDKAVIDQAKSDFEAGLSEKQVSIYKVRRIKSKERNLISKAMRLEMPQDLISTMVNRKYKEPQYAAVIEEYESGTDLSVIKEVMKEFRFGHDINETFVQVKKRLANSMEKPPEPEPVETVKEAESDKTSKEEHTEKQVIAQPSIGAKEFMDSMKMMVDAFSSTMQMQFDRMDKREQDRIKALCESEGEDVLNKRISSLQSELDDAKKELSESYSVVNSKDQIIRNLQSDLEDKDKSIKDSISERDAEIKKLREEMEQMKSGNIPGGYSQPASNPIAGDVSNVQSAGTVPMGQEQQVSQMTQQSTVNQQVSANQQTIGAGIPRVNASNTPNYTVNLTTPNGTQIPIQVERTERKSPFGLSALMSKFLPKGPAKTLLTRMIEGRYSDSQLSEIVYAYEKKLDEAEVQELLDANLPADEMHGIINVVAAAKGAED